MKLEVAGDNAANPTFARDSPGETATVPTIAHLTHAPVTDHTVPMRVLHIGKFYLPYRGGIESHLHALCRELTKSITVNVIVAN
jgi:hypothetical protein